MGQGSIVARQPAELHRRQFEIISRIGERVGQAQKGLGTELLKSRHRRRGENKGAPRCFTHRGPSKHQHPSWEEI